MANTPLSIPSATAICNPKTGVITQEWRLWFNRLYQRAGGADAPSNGEIGEQVLVGQEGLNTLQGEVGELSAALSQFDASVDNLVLKTNANSAAIASANASISSLTGSLEATNTALQKAQGVIDTAVQTVTNAGTGLSIAQAKNGTDIPLKTLKAGPGVTLDDTTNANEILISAGEVSAVSKEFGNLLVTGSLIGTGTSATTFFRVLGGTWWEIPKRLIPSNGQTVPDYNSTSGIGNLAANTSYYVVFDYALNTFRVTANPTGWTNAANAKLLWIVTTDATKIVSAVDYRPFDLMVRARTFMATATWVAGIRTYSFTSPMGNNPQKPISGEITGTDYPRYIRTQVNLLCKVADNGYAVGDEVTAVTANMMGAVYVAGPHQVRTINSSGNFAVLQNNDTFIISATTGQWAVPTANAWVLVLKVSYEYH